MTSNSGTKRSTGSTTSEAELEDFTNLDLRGDLPKAAIQSALLIGFW